MLRRAYALPPRPEYARGETRQIMKRGAPGKGENVLRRTAEQVNRMEFFRHIGKELCPSGVNAVCTHRLILNIPYVSMRHPQRFKYFFGPEPSSTTLGQAD